jgi:hypothetical protein
MGLFSRKTVSAAKNGGAYYDDEGRLVDPGGDRPGWECARCGSHNPSNPTYCGCGAHSGLAAIR